MLREFRDFINRGNFVDIAVAFVIGVAFAAVVEALTGRIVSPLIGMVVDVDLAGVGTFGPPDAETGEPVGSVGAFVEALINFIIVGFVMFLVVKAYNRLRERTARGEVDEEAPAEPDELVVLREIRDALTAR
jgi:large conductance mechanosensitive channel